MRSSPLFASTAAAILAAALAAAPQEPEAAAPRVRVLEVGTLHPVSGPAIEGGVLVIEGDSIRAVGKAGEVEIPEGAEVLSFPQAHAYPGLVDALSTAFGDALVLDDAKADAGTEIWAGLDPYQEESRALVAAGVTTAYVSNRAATAWRGIGAILHPRNDGFVAADEPTATAAAVEMRISGGNAETHPLARDKALRTVGKPFDDLDEYRKKKEEHEKALAEYAKKFEEYLDHFRKKKDGDAQGGDAATAGEGDNAEGDGSARRRRRNGGRRGGQPGNAPPSETPAERPERAPAEAPSGETKEPAAAGETEKPKEEAKPAAPKKPDYPKAPDPNPALEALARVDAGELPLRVEAQRPEEIRAALELRRAHEIPRLVLETSAVPADLAAEIAAAGVPVVTAGFVDALNPIDRRPSAGDGPARLAAAGVEVAIGSGSVSAARYLPLLAAYAAGKGLDPDAAVSAITLGAAKVLGIARRVGSLEPGKRADVVVTTGPLLASDAKIALVLSGGDTQYTAAQEAK